MHEVIEITRIFEDFVVYEVLGYGSYIIGEMRVDGELQFNTSLDLHLLKPFMGHNLSIHRSKLEVVVGMMNAWIAKLRGVIRNGRKRTRLLWF